MNLKLLQKPKAMDILVYLKRMDGQDSIGKIAFNVGGSQSTVAMRISEFIAEGLIRDTQEKKYQGKRIIELTFYGRRVADLVMNLYRVNQATVEEESDEAALQAQDEYNERQKRLGR